MNSDLFAIRGDDADVTGLDSVTRWSLLPYQPVKVPHHDGHLLIKESIGKWDIID